MNAPVDYDDDNLLDSDRKVLETLAALDAPDVPFQTIVEETDLSKSTVERASERLKQRGLVRRRQVTDDDVWLVGLAHPASAWPVPGDVEVHDPDEMQPLTGYERRLGYGMAALFTGLVLSAFHESLAKLTAPLGVPPTGVEVVAGLFIVVALILFVAGATDLFMERQLFTRARNRLLGD